MDGAGARVTDWRHAVSTPLTVTVGAESADFIGRDHLALQAAADYVAALGGGTVRDLTGMYEMGN